MSVEEFIREMLAEFQDGKRWCQGNFAMDVQGESAKIAHGHRFCLLGMRDRVLAHPFPLKAQHEIWTEFEERFVRVTGCETDWGLPNVAEWNDSRINFGEVKSVLERMLEEVK